MVPCQEATTGFGPDQTSGSSSFLRDCSVCEAKCPARRETTASGISGPSLFPHQRSDRLRTSRTSATFPPEPFSCVGIAPLGKSTRGVGFGGISRAQMSLRPLSPGCSATGSAPATRNFDFGLNQTPLYSRIDTEGVIFYNWKVSAMGQ